MAPSSSRKPAPSGSSRGQGNAVVQPPGLLRALDINDSSGVKFKHLGKRFINALEKTKSGQCKDLIQLLPELANHIKLSRKNYYEILKACISAEETHRIIKMQKYNKSKVNVQFGVSIFTKKTKYGLPVEGLSECQPPVTTDDQVLIYRGAFKVLGKINAIGRQFGGDEATEKDIDNISFDCKEAIPKVKDGFNVLIVRGGHSFIQCHNALTEYKKLSMLEDVVFECESDVKMKEPLINIQATNKPDVVGKLDKLSEKQRAAVLGILGAKCRPNPYIVFGPPGSGKTHLLIEAIAQIRARSSKKVLICAKHPNSVDLIVKRLKDVGVEATRFNAGERPESTDNPSSNEFLYDFYYPECTKPVSLKGVVASTINISGNLRGHQFDYVFIDDANHVNEAETLIPMCRLAPGGCVVLAGDPKQLVPLVELNEARHILGTSMLVRMLAIFNMYQKSADGRYNEDCITRLITSYRCDSRILAPSARLFYDHEVPCRAKTPSSLLTNSKIDKPLVIINTNESTLFHVNQISVKFDEHNMADLSTDVLLQFMAENDLKEHQVGLITLCEHQTNLAREAFRNKLYPNMQRDRMVQALSPWSYNKPVGPLITELSVKIDTVDSWEGDEREVIIISIGGLSKPTASSYIDYDKMLHSAVIRAKWAAVVVADPKVISSSKYLQAFMRHAHGVVPRFA